MILISIDVHLGETEFCSHPPVNKKNQSTEINLIKCDEPLSLHTSREKQMMKLTLSEQEQLLMKRVCDLQLRSFKRILSGQQETEIKEKLIENHVSEAELNSMIKDVVRQYNEIKNTPDNLFHRHADLLGNFREALDFNTDSLTDFSFLIPSMLRRLDLAIYILSHRN